MDTLRLESESEMKARITISNHTYKEYVAEVASRTKHLHDQMFGTVKSEFGFYIENLVESEYVIYRHISSVEGSALICTAYSEMKAKSIIRALENSLKRQQPLL